MPMRSTDVIQRLNFIERFKNFDALYNTQKTGIELMLAGSSNPLSDSAEDELNVAAQQAAFMLNKLRENLQSPIKEAILSLYKTKLDLSEYGITDQEISIISHLISFTLVTTLCVSENKISDEGAGVLAQNIYLTNLNVSHNKIGYEGAEALAQNTHLTILDLSHNKIGDRGATAMARNIHLTRLDLGYNGVGVEGAKALAENDHLTRLGLRYNGLGDEGAKVVARNKLLTWLDLSHNKIGDEGAKALARNRYLIGLDLSYNKIANEGIKAFVQNTNLTCFIGYRSRGDHTTVQLIRERLRKNCANVEAFRNAVSAIAQAGANSIIPKNVLHQEILPHLARSYGLFGHNAKEQASKVIRNVQSIRDNRQAQATLLPMDTAW